MEFDKIINNVESNRVLQEQKTSLKRLAQYFLNLPGYQEPTKHL